MNRLSNCSVCRCELGSREAGVCTECLLKVLNYKHAYKCSFQTAIEQVTAEVELKMAISK